MTALFSIENYISNSRIKMQNKKGGKPLDKALVNMIYSQMDKTTDGEITQQEFIQAWINAEQSIQVKIEQNEDEIQKAQIAMEQNQVKLKQYKNQEKQVEKNPYLLSTLTISVVEGQNIPFEKSQASFEFNSKSYATNYITGTHPNFDNYQIQFNEVSPQDQINVYLIDGFDQDNRLVGILKIDHLKDQKIHDQFIQLKSEHMMSRLSQFGKGNNSQLSPQLHIQVHYIYSKAKFTQTTIDKWKEYINKYQQQNDKLKQDLSKMYTRMGFIESLKNEPAYYEQIKPGDRIAMKSSYEPKFKDVPKKPLHPVFTICLLIGLLMGLVAIACMDYKNHILIDICIPFFLITMYFVDFVDFTFVSILITIVFLVISLGVEITWYIIYTKNWHDNVYIDAALLISFRRYEKYISWILMVLKSALIILLVAGLCIVGRNQKSKSYSTGYNSKVTVPLHQFNLYFK